MSVEQEYIIHEKRSHCWYWHADTINALITIANTNHFPRKRVSNASFQWNQQIQKKNLNSHETYRSDYPHTQTKESRRRNHCCFYRTLINLFLPFKPRLWYAKSRHLSLTFPRLTEKNGADPGGLLSWMHQLEQTFLSCIRNVEIRSNGRTY